MKILVIGSGGREHALVQTFHRQGHTVYCLPGNAGTDALTTPVSSEWKQVSVNHHHRLATFAKQHSIDLTVVGPENPLSEGIADLFKREGLALFGPPQSATRLEGSKAYAKKFMSKHRIPTARYEVCSTPEEALMVVKRRFDEWGGVVIKPDGLTAGKGVIPCVSLEEAAVAVETIMEKRKYGASGETVVIEELLKGQEISILAFCDGNTIAPMIPSQDHKRLLDGDKGPNTGGIGAYTPLPFLTPKEKDAIQELVINTTMKGLAEEHADYKGVLFFGLMLTEAGPRVLEFNCRFGDPETQVVLPLIKSDLAGVMRSCIEGTLQAEAVQWLDKAACCVVLCSGGYPESYRTGKLISGLEACGKDEHILCFHAGTRKHPSGNYFTSGGRVLAVTGIGDTLEEAVEKAYEGAGLIDFEEIYYRKDIARKAMSPAFL